MSARAIITPIIRTALGFVREHTPESSTRLCAILLCVTGCVVALGTVAYAFGALIKDPTGSHATTVTALVGVSSALIASGCVAIINRTEKSAESIAACSGITTPATSTASASSAAKEDVG